MKSIGVSLSFIYLINLLLGICLAEINPHGFGFGSLTPSNSRANSETQQCPITLGVPTDGLKARFYRYVYTEDTPNILDEDFLDHEYYMGDRYLGEVDGVYDVSFNFFYGTQTGVISQGQINGFNLTISNFSVEYTGWFVPETSGKYTFQIGQTDDGTLLEMYGTNEVICCDSVQTENFTLYSIQYYDNTTVHTGTMEMIAGESYPFRIVFFNRDAVAIQTITFTDPDGVVHKDFTGYAKYYDNMECPGNNDIQASSSSMGVVTTTITGPVTTVTASFTMTQTGMTVTTVETVSVPNETTNVTTTEIITFPALTSTAIIVTTVAVPTEMTSLLTVTDIVTEDGSPTTVTEVITLAPPFVNVTVFTTPSMTESMEISISTSIIIVTETKPIEPGSQVTSEFNSVTQYETFTTTIYSLVTLYSSNSIRKSSMEGPSATASVSRVGGGETTTSINSNDNENNNIKTGTTTTVVNGNTYINGGKVSTATAVNENTNINSGKVITTTIVNGNNDVKSGTVSATVVNGIPTVAVVDAGGNSAGNNAGVALSRKSTLAAVGRPGSSTRGVIVNNNEGNSLFDSNILLMILMLFVL